MNAEDEAIARIRAADPATWHVTDLSALRRAVDARVGGDAAADAPQAPEPPEVPTLPHESRGTDELAARRARRSRRNAWLAGVAASVVVGASGYLAGVSGIGAGMSGTGGGEDAEDAAAQSAAGEGGAADGEAMEEQAQDDAVASDGVATEDADTMLATSRAVFVASGLPDEAGTAEAFAYDPTGVASASRAEEIATGLGIAGDAVEQDGAWTVTGDDGRVVQVYADGVASVSYLDPALDPWACAVSSSDVSDPDAGELGSCATAEPTDPVGAARDFLTTIGVDVAGLELVVDHAEQGVATVGGYVDGVDRTAGPQWTITVVADGVYSAWGGLAPRTSLGSYDVISAADAVDRLMDPRFGASPVVQPYETGAEASGDAPVSSTPGSPGAPPEPGSTIPWPVQTYTITDAALVLGQYTLPDGAVALLPTWSLTSDDGLTWSVVAVTDDALDFDADAG